MLSFFSTQHHPQGQGSSKTPSQLTQALLLAFLLQAPAPLFIPMVRTCWLRAMISPGCFCPGSGNDPLKKQLVQHLGKEEQASIGNKNPREKQLRTINLPGISTDPSACSPPSQETSDEFPSCPQGGGMLTGYGGGKVPGCTSDLNKHKHI